MSATLQNCNYSIHNYHPYLRMIHDPTSTNFYIVNILVYIPTGADLSISGSPTTTDGIITYTLLVNNNGGGGLVQASKCLKIPKAELDSGSINYIGVIIDDGTIPNAATKDKDRPRGRTVVHKSYAQQV